MNELLQDCLFDWLNWFYFEGYQIFFLSIFGKVYQKDNPVGPNHCTIVLYPSFLA